jgi:hypothetical protein
MIAGVRGKGIQHIFTSNMLDHLEIDRAASIPF